MLQIQHICKEYRTGTLVQKALDDVSLNFRDNEFVAILGPSGSGKTTFLIIIGGLDRYDSGDLIINGISTKKYKDRDWDSYRNHTIGFVFQSYNLIPHQTVLANVELALTISGVSKSERRRRAKEALEKGILLAQTDYQSFTTRKAYALYYIKKGQLNEAWKYIQDIEKLFIQNKNMVTYIMGL